MTGLVMQACGNLVEVDILELSRFPSRSVGICLTSIGSIGANDGKGNRPEADTGNG